MYSGSFVSAKHSLWMTRSYPFAQSALSYKGITAVVPVPPSLTTVHSAGTEAGRLALMASVWNP